ncbi:PREDICTED: nitrogen permease regulator 2-like protein [Acropora digitifera]|uniref:nitrogen permease regulator 2-like protein n=1 Tax=Acropora digitifera TaxID=70779 RepID=UPI00077B1196|nr:PREDICTED: nitrogen permease regulator 2-like protein [Acropora digitifera]
MQRVIMSGNRDIQCILFCEFHPIAGPKIVHQFPEDYISKEKFDCVAVYIIPKPELQSKLITINALEHKFVGCPISIENAKYSRNALLFNVCFVLAPDVDTIRYEGVVKKLAGYMVTLELESGYLSQEDTKSSLPTILSEIFYELNNNGKCTIQIGKLVHCNPNRKEKVCYLGHNSLFATLFTIHANLLCSVSFLKRRRQHENDRLGETENVNPLDFGLISGRTPPSFRDVFMLYCGLSPGATVKDLCTRYSPSNLRVDERRLIQFGMVTGIIRRLHKYPVQLTAPSKSTSLSRGHLRFRGKQADTNRLKLSDKWLDGNHNYDEICCETGLTYQELEDIVEGEPHIVVIWK